MNFTGLGVGNRNGVHIQLAGTVIAVMGMIYAFYVKPVIKRRRRDAVWAAAENLQVAKATETASVRPRRRATQRPPRASIPNGSCQSGREIEGLARIREVSMKRVLLHSVDLAVLVLLTGGMTRLVLRQRADTPGSEFARSVDLSSLQGLAVQTEGRIKSFDSTPAAISSLSAAANRSTGRGHVQLPGPNAPPAGKRDRRHHLY